jgi:hypothetical protein
MPHLLRASAADQHAEQGGFKEVELMRRHGRELLAVRRPPDLTSSERVVGVPLPLRRRSGE